MNKEICKCPKCKREPKKDWIVLECLNGKREFLFWAGCRLCKFDPLPAESPEMAIARWNACVLDFQLSKYTENRIKEFACPACGGEIDYSFIGIVKGLSSTPEDKFGYGILLKCTNPDCVFQRIFHFQELPGLIEEWKKYCEWVKEGCELKIMCFNKTQLDKWRNFNFSEEQNEPAGFPIDKNKQWQS